MALDNLPHSWLEDLFSRYPRRLLATRLKVLDDLMARRAYDASVGSYALAFALLTESVEDAIDILSRPPVKQTPLSPALEQFLASGLPVSISRPEWTSLPQPAIGAISTSAQASR